VYAAQFLYVTVLLLSCHLIIFSATVADQFGPSQVKASRWMNTLAVKGQPAKTFEFKAVYDARKTLRDKKLLEQLNVSQLKIHDFVILEVRVARYFLKEKDSGSDGKGKKRAVDHWQAFFDLQAIYKIKDAIGMRFLLQFPVHY
jgi:hypothetical protein